MVVGSPTKLNLIPSGVMPVVYINQGDAGYDKEFLIYNGDSPYNVPAGVSATIRGKKADGYGVTEAAALTEGSNLVTVTITEQMVAAAGANLYELVFVDTNGLRVASINMVWAVKADALGDAVISDSDLSYVNEALDKIQGAEAMKNQMDTNTADIAAETAARIAADSAETAARIAADNALQAGISNESAARLSTDNTLQQQINQLVAPSGSAPSAAEVQNARIGADGKTYSTLGDAIRTQITNTDAKISNAVSIFENDRFSVSAFGAGTFDDGTYYPTVRPYRCSSMFVFVLPFEIELAANTGYRFVVEYVANGTWTQTNWITRYTVPAYTQFGIVVGRSAELEDTSSTADIDLFLSNIIVTETRFAEVDDRLTELEQFNSITEDERFLTDIFGAGETENGIYYPTVRPFRCSIKAPISFSFSDIQISVRTGYRFLVDKYINGAWTRSAWITTSTTIAAGEIFTLIIGRVTEDASSTADLDELVGSLTVTAKLTARIAACEISDYLLADGHFSPDLFNIGELFNGHNLPTARPWRVSTLKPMKYGFDIELRAASGYRFQVQTYTNGSWSGTWKTSQRVGKNTEFAFLIAKVTEDTASTADVDAFVNSVIATSDITNIVELISSSNITSEIESKLSAHMAHFYNSEKADSFIFFTDPHLMGSGATFDQEQFDIYSSLLNDVSKRITSEFVLCGGDWLNSGDTQTQAAVKLGYVDGQMRKLFGDRYKPVVGNHDFNYLGVDAQGTRLPDTEWVQDAAMANFWFSNYGSTYYSFKTTNTTYYVLNTGTDYDGPSELSNFNKEQLNWLSQRLILDNPERAVICMHIYYLSSVGTTIPKRVQAVGKMISAFNNHETCVLTLADDGYEMTYNFEPCIGKIYYTIVGHSHADFEGTFGGVPIIGTANMQSGGIPTFDMLFTDYTAGKLYCTRIGTGSNREINI